MKLEQAQALQVGQPVSCPADRGNPAYIGCVERIDTQVQRPSVPGVSPYVWVTVRRLGAHASVWPSNRLG